MRRKMRNGFALLLAALAVLALVGCPQPTESTLSSDASLQSVKVAGVSAVSLGKPSTDWSKAELGYVYITDENLLANAEISVTKKDSSQVVYYALASGIMEPYFEENAKITFTHGDAFYLEVFSPNQDARIFYKIGVFLAGPFLSTVSIGSVSADNLGTPGKTLDDGDLVTGSIILPSTATNAVLTTGMIDTTTVKYARVNGHVLPNRFSVLDTTPIQFQNGDSLYIESTSATGDKRYYCIEVNVKDNDYQLASVVLNNSTSIEIPGAVTAWATTAITADAATAAFVDWAGATALPGTLPIKIVPRSSAAQVWVARVPREEVTTYTLDRATWTNLTNLTTQSVNVTGFRSGDYVIVRVITEYGTTAYYRYRFYNSVANIGTAVALSSLRIGTGTLGAGNTVNVTSPNSAATPTPYGTTFANAPIVGIGYLASVGSAVVVGTPAYPAGQTAVTVRYGTSTATGTAPTNWGTATTLSALNPGDFIGVEVTSQQGLLTVFYKFRVADGTKNHATAPAGVTISGRPATLGTPAYAFANADGGAVSLTSAQVAVATAAAPRIVVSGIPTGATVRYGTSTADATAPTNWNATQATTAYANNNRIGIEITAEDGFTMSFYKILVTTANSAVLSAATVGGVSATTLGTPSGAWNNDRLTAGAVTLNSTTSVNAALTGTSAGSTVQYAKVTGSGAPTFAPISGATETFTNGDLLYFQVTQGSYVNVYKIAVTVTTP